MGSALDNVGASGGTKHRYVASSTSWIGHANTLTGYARSRIAHDLVKHEQCKFDDMLPYFLERCLIDPNAAPNDAGLSVLQSCLEGVLPICNSEDMKHRLVHQQVYLPPCSRSSVHSQSAAAHQDSTNGADIGPSPTSPMRH